MSGLTAGDFGTFHQEVHGFLPFPWQDHLANRVLRERRFPDLVDVPTGAGKTTLMDIALFALAVDATAPPERRWVPRRIFLIVDRRVIVDQAGERALMLARRLEEARSGGGGASVVEQVAQALSSLSGGGDPLVPAILRGGTLRDDNWARQPDQPVLGASTVDQVGSRILFSGYGVRGLAASIHAGLLGRDTLFLLDEVHLSRPFRDTLRDVRRYAGDLWCSSPTGLPNQFVELSATPERDAEGSTQTVVGLSAEDRAHPLIRQRLDASKSVELVETSSGGQSAFVGAFVKQAREMVQNHRTVGVVVNRVASARAICQALEPYGERMGFDVHLVTGRMRALDRQDLLDRIEPRIRAGRTRSAEDRPLIIVATQCIEAGADLDFDALVTECASLDALKQRFGRVDRLGQYRSAEGVIIARKSDVSASGGDDPVYGNALRETWSWLRGLLDEAGEAGRLDFGLDSLRSFSPGPGVSAPTHAAPVMLPAHLDAWAQTGPPPALQPDISLWLHGPQVRARDVQIVWRGDLREEELEAAAGASGTPGEERGLAMLLDRLSFAPPTSPETLAVPLTAVRAWLSIDGSSETEVADVEGAREVEGRSRGGIRPALVWQGDRSRVVSSPGDLRAGMTLVLPSGYGGLSMGTWDPTAVQPIADLGDRAQFVARGRVTIRLHPAIFSGESHSAPPQPRGDETRTREVELDEIKAWLDSAANGTHREPWLEVAQREIGGVGARGRILRVFASTTGNPQRWWGIALKKRRPLNVIRELRGRERAYANMPAGSGGVVPLLALGSLDSGLEYFVEDFDSVEHSSFVGREVALGEHLAAVGEKASEFARNLGLPRDLQETLWWAGRLHDVGKADRRFQLWLHGGDEIELAASGRLLAKSPIPNQDSVARRAARVRAGYPPGLRHEMASTAMVESAKTFLECIPDRDLLLHLIASHHGWGRPFAPPVLDPRPTEVRYRPDEKEFPELRSSTDETLAAVDSGVAERFWRLNRRFGWHGLAFLEALLRLADHRISEAEENA